MAGYTAHPFMQSFVQSNKSANNVQLPAMFLHVTTSGLLPRQQAQLSGASPSMSMTSSVQNRRRLLLLVSKHGSTAL